MTESDAALERVRAYLHQHSADEDQELVDEDGRLLC